jgi:1-deoxy-D-xylulose-5-phosphate reductoisomerase
MAALGKLEFFPPDLAKFPCLGLAYRAGDLGGTAPAIVNAANEAVVARFLEDRAMGAAGAIGFTDIPRVIAAVLDAAEIKQRPGLDDVIAADAWARKSALRIMNDGPDTQARSAPSIASAVSGREGSGKASARTGNR